MPISSNFSGHWHQRHLSKRKEHSAALQSVSFLPPPVCTMLLGLSSNTLFWRSNRAGMAKVSWSTSTQSWKSWKWQKLKIGSFFHQWDAGDVSHSAERYPEPLLWDQLWMPWEDLISGCVQAWTVASDNVIKGGRRQAGYGEDTPSHCSWVTTYNSGGKFSSTYLTYHI